MRYFDIQDLVSAHSRGHEIGCHTFDHVPVPSSSDGELALSLAANEKFIRTALGPVTLTSFAYPLGEVNIRTKKFFGGRFTSCRGGFPGLNSGSIDLALLRSISLDSRFDPEHDLPPLLDEAIRHRGWLIFCAHDITPSPSRWGCTPSVLRTIVESIRRSGIEIACMRDVVKSAEAAPPVPDACIGT